MNTAFSLMAAGVQLVPASRKVPADPFLVAFMVVFFTYVTWLLWRSSKEP
jgi:hypothetical protein